MFEAGATATVANDVDSIYGDVYQRLKAMASRQRLRGGAPRTLCTTELVHETYLRMGESNFRYEESAQFFAYAARAMRHILTDAARRRLQTKRGGDQTRLDMADPAVEAAHLDPQLALQLDDALLAVEAGQPRRIWQQRVNHSPLLIAGIRRIPPGPHRPTTLVEPRQPTTRPLRADTNTLDTAR